MSVPFYFLLTTFYFFSLSGCGPKYTYPADQVPQSVESLCKKEFDLEVVSRVVGKTLGAMVLMEDILDAKGQVPKEAHEVMGRVMQTVSRVALSTDLPLDFCVVVLRDKTQGNELLVIRFVDDIKRANAEAIGIEESINRTIFGQGRYIKNSQGEPVFVLSEIKLETFLADQIAQRSRFNFAKDLKEDPVRPLVLVDGVFEDDGKKKEYRFSLLSLKANDPRQMTRTLLQTARQVFQGYRFHGFDALSIQDYANRQTLTIDRQTYLEYENKKITEDQILDQFLTESQSIQDAFKLFGFHLVQDAQEPAAPVSATP